MRIFLCIAFLFFICVSGTSQSVNKLLRLAYKAVDNGDFGKGTEYYRQALAKDSNNFYANLEYGLLLFEYMNEPSRAGKYLVKAEKNSPKDTMPEMLFGLGKYYHYKANYNKAIFYYERFRTYIDLKVQDGILLEAEVKGLNENCRFALVNPGQGNSKRIKVSNLGPEINTIYPEYVPVLSPDKNTLMFTSRRRVTDKSKIDDENGGFYEDMYMATRNADGKFKNPKPFSLQANKMPGSEHVHESAISLSFVGDRFFSFYNGKIYESTKQGTSWSSPAMLSDELNNQDEFKNHVCISPDGNTLIYSAEGSNGLGGLDLYKSVKGPDGKWKAGENLGPGINTKDDEGGPFMSEDGTTLYFSSKGWPGYGGYDFFKSKFENSNWSKPQNMGSPFNGAGDDIYISINTKETEGFLSSSRSGGYGDMDIYKIGYEKPFTPFKQDSLGRLAIMMADTFNVGDTVAMMLNTQKLPEVATAYWKVNDSILNSEGEKIIYVFKSAGTNAVKVQAELKEDGELIGAEKNIFVREKKIIAATSATALPALETIYFELNKADIDGETAMALDRNLEMLRKHPGVMIEIAAYGDSRGSAAYNRVLSQKRAVTTLNYLKKKGFNAALVRHIGSFGESNPINRCSDEVPCSEEEYRLNRRVEMKWAEPKK